MIVVKICFQTELNPNNDEGFTLRPKTDACQGDHAQRLKT